MSIVWDPADRKPEDAAALEEEILRVAGGAQVKLTLTPRGWLVRALGPASMCSRGGELAARDVSRAVAEVLADSGHEVTLVRA
jgi:hypothetical protein